MRRAVMLAAMLCSGAAWADDPCATQRASVKAAKANGDEQQAQRMGLMLAACQKANGIAESDADHDAAVANLKRNDKAMSAVFGASLCLVRGARNKVLKEIATQKKYARIGGTVDLRVMHDLQQDVRRLDELEAADLKLLKTEYRKVKPLGCNTDEVVTICICKVQDPPEGPCAQRGMRAATSLVTDPNGSVGE